MNDDDEITIPSTGEQFDEFGRPVVPPGLRTSIANAFRQIPEYKADGTPARAAVVIIADHTGEARVTVAAKINGDWKVAGGAGYRWKDKKTSWFVGVEYVF